MTVTTTNTPTKPNIISIKELYPSWLSGDIVKNIPHKTKTITNKLAIDALFMVISSSQKYYSNATVFGKEKPLKVVADTLL